MSKYVAESITMIAGRFGHEGLCQLRTELVLYAVDKGLRGRNVLQSLLLILLRICSRSVRTVWHVVGDEMNKQYSMTHMVLIQSGDCIFDAYPNIRI